MMKRLISQRQSAGFILPIVLIVMVVISFMIFAISSSTLVNYNRARLEVYGVSSQLAADAGFDEALVELTNDTDWPGSGGEVTLLSAGDIKTTYETEVNPGVDAEHRVIAVIARTYAPATANEATLTRHFEIDIEAVTSGTGASSVVSGVGGLILSSNAKISGGDVLVNGKINLNNNAQIGLTNNSVNVRVAHQSCPIPVDATFPRVCASGENGQPITIGNNGKIYANVQATNQTDGTNMLNPGLIAGSSFAPVPLPNYDRDGQKAAVTTTLDSDHSTIACGNNQTKTWPANLKITGNFTPGNNCTINITGDVWITGNVGSGNNARFVIASSAGTDRPIMMVDGSSGLTLGNNSQIISNSSGTGMEVVTYWSAAGCTPDCADVTGTSLSSSQNVTTINLSNNGSAQNSIFYARWSKVIVSNNGGLGAIAGQTVELGNNAVISFTASVPGSDNLVTTWVKRGYMRTAE